MAGPAVPEPIGDPEDPRLEPYARMRERDLVRRSGRFVVEGLVSLRLLLGPRSRFAAESVLVAPERWPDVAPAMAACPAPPPVYSAGKAVMSAVAGFPIHRGVLAIGLAGAGPDPAGIIPPPPAPAAVLALAGLTNHDNVGGLFRNAAAFGADAVILDRATCDPLYRKAIRVSAGAALTVPFARAADAAAMLALADRHGLEPLALTPGAAAEVGRTPLPRRALVMLGTEGAGLPPAVIARARALRIAMEAGFDSLNVAVAGAIVLHRLHAARNEAERARGEPRPAGDDETR